jgi:NAD-dependent DNA ligase
MDIEGLGDVLVDQLCDAKLVRTFADLYAERDDIANLGSEVEQGGKVVKRTVGEKVANKVIANIENSRAQGLDRLLSALGFTTSATASRTSSRVTSARSMRSARRHRRSCRASTRSAK